jgi:hypothetical protein
MAKEFYDYYRKPSIVRNNEGGKSSRLVKQKVALKGEGGPKQVNGKFNDTSSANENE